MFRFFFSRSFMKCLAVCITLVHITCVFIIYINSYRYNYNVQDREVLLGHFLYSENSSTFNFEAFKSFMALSDNPDFQLKLHPDKYTLNDLTMEKYFQKIDEKTFCFIEGTDFSRSKSLNRCVCKSRNVTQLYYGYHCGIPQPIWQISGKDDTERNQKTWKLRKKPRRLIYALPMNHEFDLFETRLSLNYDVVDVFLVGESNYTNSGGTKEPHFLLRFATGWMKKYQNKLLYVFQGYFPDEGYENGIIADGYMRRHLTRSGFKRLKGVQPDDLFVYTDGDELIKPEILTFLKLYEGYSQPIAFKYKWSIFGFFWTVQEETFEQQKSPEPGGMTVGFFKDFYKYDSSHVRTRDYQKDINMIEIYQNANVSVGMWDIYDAGWHCSWCFKPEGIRKKLLDAPKSDYPRYGDDIGKTNVDYIKRLIKHGLYFNLGRLRTGGKELTPEDDPEMAPQFVLDNRDRMGYLLFNPYKDEHIYRFKFKHGNFTHDTLNETETN